MAGNKRRSSRTGGARRTRRLSVTRVTAALEAAGGSISNAARLLGCARQSVYRAIAAHPELMKALQRAREQLLDGAELALRAAVERGEPWAIRFTLRYLGWSRGYGRGGQFSSPLFSQQNPF